MSLCYSPIHSDEEDDDDNAAYESTGVPLPQPSILSTNSPFVLRPDPYAPDLASLFRPNDDTPVCVVQHPYSSLNTKITHASVVEDDDESEPTYLFLGYDSGFDPDSKNARHSQTYNADAILAWDCCTGKVIDSLAIPGASCMYVRASSSGMVAATTIYERVKARRRGVFFRPLTTIYVYVYADQRYHQLKSIAPRGYRSSPVAVVADSTCARFMVILTKNGRLLHQHLLGPSISTEVTALKDGPGPDGAELALLTDDMTGILLERSRPRIVVFIAEARHGVEVLQQVDLRKVMEASGQNFSRLLSSGALLPHFGGEGFAVLWKNNYVYFDMYSDIEGIKRARPKSRTIASLKRPSGIDIIAAVPTTVHWLALQLSDDRLLWRWWSPGETLIKEEPETTERAVKEEPAAGEVQMAVVKAEPLSGPMDSNGEEEEEEPDYDGALRDDEKGVEVISLSDSVDDGYDSDIEIIGSVAVVDLDAVEGGVAVEAPWGGTAMYNEDENGVVLLDDDLEDDRAATSDLLSTVNAATDQGAATRADPINAATLELPPDARTRYAPGKSIEFSPLSVSTSASTADEHARELWERAKADEAMASDEIEAQDWAAVHWPDVFEQNLKRRRKCVDRLISDIETNWSSTLCLRPRIPPLLEADIEMVGKCFQRLARKRGPALILDVRQSTKRDRHLFLSSLIAGSLLVVGDDVDDQCRANSSGGSSSSSRPTEDLKETDSSSRSDTGTAAATALDDGPVKMFHRITGVSWEKTRVLAAEMCHVVTAFSDYEQRTEIFARVHKRHLQNQKADTKQGYKHYWWIRCDRCGKYRRAPYYIAKHHGVDNETPPEFHCGLLQQRVEGGVKPMWKPLSCEDPPDEAETDEDEQLEAQRYDTESSSSDTNTQYDSERERRCDQQCTGIITASRRHKKERNFQRKIKLIKKNLRAWNKKISKAETEEIERARKERAKYAGNDDIDDDNWQGPSGHHNDKIDGRKNSESSSSSQVQLNTSRTSSTTRADTSAFSLGSQYDSDSDPDNDFGDLPSDPDENEELKRLAGRIMRVHMSSLNSYSRFGRRPQRKKPAGPSTTSRETSKFVPSPKKASRAPQKVLTTVINASSEDAPWETVFMAEVADNKNLKESVKDDLIKMMRVLTDELATGGSLSTLRRCLQVGRAVKRWIPEEASSWSPIRKVASELVFLARDQIRELSLHNGATTADVLLMPPELPQQASGVRRHRPEGDVSNTMHSIIQGIARDADEAANVGSQRSKLRRIEVGTDSEPSGGGRRAADSDVGSPQEESDGGVADCDDSDDDDSVVVIDVDDDDILDAY